MPAFPLPRWLIRLLPALAILAFPGRAAEERNGPESEAVKMPAFTVTETKEGLPWLYGQIPGYEVLSLCGRDQTENFVAALYRARHTILPRQFMADTSLPTLVVLYNQKPDQNVPAQTIGHLPSPQAAEIWDNPNAQGTTGIIGLPDRDRLIVCANLYRYGGSFTLLWQEYQRLFRAAVPTAPEWFREGVVGRNGVYQTYRVRHDNLELPKARWGTAEKADAILRNPSREIPLLPWEEIFGRPGPPKSDANYDLWYAQAAIFCRWAIVDGDQKRALSYWQFGARAAREPATEAIFQQYFGFGYARLDEVVRAYLPTALHQVVNRPLPDVKIPKMTLRPATEAEVGRMKGDFERAQGAALTKGNPDLAQRYLELAGRSFRRALKLDLNNDPGLVAAVGLYEIDHGEAEKGRDFLEHALAAHVNRPAAYLRVATLHFEDAAAKPAAAEGKFSAQQVRAILEPLYALRDKQPLQAVIYLKIAEAWARSAAAPTEKHLAVLQEGLKLFPLDTRLARTAAEVYRQYGFTAEAERIARRRLSFPIDANGRRDLASFVTDASTAEKSD